MKRYHQWLRPWLVELFLRVLCIQTQPILPWLSFQIFKTAPYLVAIMRDHNRAPAPPFDSPMNHPPRLYCAANAMTREARYLICVLMSGGQDLFTISRLVHTPHKSLARWISKKQRRW